MIERQLYSSVCDFEGIEVPYTRRVKVTVKYHGVDQSGFYNICENCEHRIFWNDNRLEAIVQAKLRAETMQDSQQRIFELQNTIHNLDYSNLRKR